MASTPGDGVAAGCSSSYSGHDAGNHNVDEDNPYDAPAFFDQEASSASLLHRLSLQQQRLLPEQLESSTELDNPAPHHDVTYTMHYAVSFSGKATDAECAELRHLKEDEEWAQSRGHQLDCVIDMPAPNAIRPCPGQRHGRAPGREPTAKSWTVQRGLLVPVHASVSVGALRIEHPIREGDATFGIIPRPERCVP